MNDRNWGGKRAGAGKNKRKVKQRTPLIQKTKKRKRIKVVDGYFNYSDKENWLVG